MVDILEEIITKTRERVKAQKRRAPLADLQRQMAAGRKPVSLTDALRRSDLITLIAELKQASPSAGVIRKENDLAGRVQGYARGGASALSILTEEYFFHGSPYILEVARKETALPILRKDFIIDPYQIEESRQMGADAILLITTVLPPSLLKELLDHAQEVGLDALVEAHAEEDLDKALKAGARLIGINHRNLRTLQMDMTLSEKLLPRIPKDKTVVVESGIKRPDELPHFHELGAHAVLIGETLMRDPAAEAVVRSFVEAGTFSKRKSA